jgi:hypothetical protein
MTLTLTIQTAAMTMTMTIPTTPPSGLGVAVMSARRRRAPMTILTTTDGLSHERRPVPRLAPGRKATAPGCSILAPRRGRQ